VVLQPPLRPMVQPPGESPRRYTHAPTDKGFSLGFRLVREQPLSALLAEGD